MRAFVKGNVFGVEELKHDTTLHMDNMLGFPCLFTADLYAYVDSKCGRLRLLHKCSN